MAPLQNTAVAEIEAAANQLIDLATKMARDSAKGETPGLCTSTCMQAIVAVVIGSPLRTVADVLLDPAPVVHLAGIEHSLKVIAAAHLAAHRTRKEQPAQPEKGSDPKARTELSASDIRKLLATGGNESPVNWTIDALCELSPSALAAFLAGMRYRVMQKWIDEVFGAVMDLGNMAHIDFAWRCNDIAILLKHGARPDSIHHDPYCGLSGKPIRPTPRIAEAPSPAERMAAHRARKEQPTQQEKDGNHGL